MTDSIKNFIEYNIDIIEDADWEKLVEAWDDYSYYLFCGDDYFKELTEVFQGAGINFMTLSEDARKKFMSNLIDQILCDELESMYSKGKDEVKKSDILQHINCVFGFTDEEIDKIMEDVAVKSYNLEPDFTCFYVR